MSVRQSLTEHPDQYHFKPMDPIIDRIRRELEGAALPLGKLTYYTLFGAKIAEAAARIEDDHERRELYRIALGKIAIARELLAEYIDDGLYPHLALEHVRVVSATEIDARYNYHDASGSSPIQTSFDNASISPHADVPTANTLLKSDPHHQFAPQSQAA